MASKREVARPEWQPRSIIGKPEEIGQALATMKRRNMQLRNPRVVEWLPDGRAVAVVDHLTVPPRHARRVGKVARRLTYSALTLAALAIVGAIGFGVAIAVGWVMTHLAAVLLGGFLLLVIAGIAGGGGRGRTFSGTFRGKMH